MGRDVAGETYYPGLAASDMEGEGGGHQYFGEGTNIWGRVPIFGEGTNIFRVPERMVGAHGMVDRAGWVLD